MTNLKPIKAKTRRTKAYPGDTWIGIDIILNNGASYTAFGVWPKSDRFGRYYLSDNCGTYKTLAEAKARAFKAAEANFAKSPQGCDSSPTRSKS